MKLPSGIKMKFCESLDRFVEIRDFTNEEKQLLLKNIKINNKKDYKRLIINACIVNYLNEIAPLIFDNKEYPLLEEIIEQELYNLCIKVNPSLDIKEVTISIDDDSEKRKQQIQLLGGEEIKNTKKDKNLLSMEHSLKRRIVGQDPAVSVICQAIRKAKVGLKNPNKPIGSFMFIGQTGVGKTELAKALTEYLFENENHMVRIDCSEYSQSHEYAKLIGAPPGYIGHKEGGFLTEAIKSKPNTVVLFDEIEKAHKKVHNLLLQIMDDGILTDSKGTLVSFKQTVLIMTSNVGVHAVKKTEKSIGFNSKEKLDHKSRQSETIKALEEAFSPEFINRIDEVVVFYSLTKEDNMEIIDIMLSELIERLHNINLDIKFTKKAKEFLVNNGTNLKYGARPLKRAIQKYIINPLSEEILEGKYKPNTCIKTKVKKDSITFYSK